MVYDRTIRYYLVSTGMIVLCNDSHWLEMIDLEHLL